MLTQQPEGQLQIIMTMKDNNHNNRTNRPMTLTYLSRGSTIKFKKKNRN